MCVIPNDISIYYLAIAEKHWVYIHHIYYTDNSSYTVIYVLRMYNDKMYILLFWKLYKHYICIIFEINHTEP